MSTFKEIIDRVDEFKPNNFSRRIKLKWLTDLNGKLAADVFLMGIEEIRAMPHEYPDALECKPVVSYPHDDIYDLWLEAKIDFANGDYDKYQNTMEHYNESLDNFRNYFINTYRPAQGRQVCGFEPDPGFPVYYITAYGMDVMKGFRGSIEDWFESMKIKGDPGKNAYEYALDGGYDGTEEEFSDLLNQGKTAYMYAVEGGYTGSVAEFRAKMAMVYAPLNHDHDGAYAKLNHAHDGAYAKLNHGHDLTYASLNHNHDTVYAKIKHDHTAEEVGALPVAGGLQILLASGYMVLSHYQIVDSVEAIPADAPDWSVFLVPMEE